MYNYCLEIGKTAYLTAIGVVCEKSDGLLLKSLVELHRLLASGEGVPLVPPFLWISCWLGLGGFGWGLLVGVPILRGDGEAR